MTIFRGFSFLSWTILLLISASRFFGVAANDRASEEFQELPEDASGRETPRDSVRIRSSNNSPALNHFLTEVLNAQNELKWIDRAVYRPGNHRSRQAPARRNNEEETDRENFEKELFADEDSKIKREIENAIETDDSKPTLESLKRTVVELSRSLDPHENKGSKIRRNEDRSLDGMRKLLSSQNDARSAVGIAIEYYDYEDEDDPSAAAVMTNQPSGRAVKHSVLGNAEGPETAGNTLSMKKDEHAEEEREKELQLQNLKNKIPKEEFLSNESGSNSEGEKPRGPSSKVPSNPAMSRKISADEDSESSDDRRWNPEGSRDPRHSDDPNSSVDLWVKNEPKFLQKRTYLLLSSSNEKKTIKRSVDVTENEEEKKNKFRLNSDADKSAKNYAALKSTDDMFKGGVEQSNPLDEDKLSLVEGTRLSVLPTSYNSLTLLKSFKTKTTNGPEWKVFQMNGRKIVQQKSSMKIGRHLAQIVQASRIDNASISTTFLVPCSTEKYFNSTIFMPESSSVTNMIANHTSNAEPTIFALEKASETKIQNKTRLRRHAGSFNRENIKSRINRAHKRRKQRENSPASKNNSDTSDPQQRKLTVLLAADNINDESQIDLAVHGELAGKIVEKIFEKVQENEGLKVALGPGLSRKQKPQESSKATGKKNHEAPDKDGVKETETMMKRVMELLGRLVFDEVRRRTCSPLSPDLRQFLLWTLGFDDLSDSLSVQVPPLPGIPENKSAEKTTVLPEKFLFPNTSSEQQLEDLKTQNLNELAKKVNLLRGLITEYNALSEREKTKVHTVHDYLLRQLTVLLKHIESKEKSESGEKSGADGEKAPQILQYQGQPGLSNSKETPKNSTNTSVLPDSRSSIGRQRAYAMFDAKPVLLPYPNHYSRASRKTGLSWNDRKKRRIESNAESERLKKKKNSRSLKPDDSVEDNKKLFNEIVSLRRKKRADHLGFEIPRIFVESAEPRATSSSSPFSSSLWPSLRAEEFSLIPKASSLNTSIPVRGKNRLEDEVLLLNKREAWKKQNQLLLEEVAFGKDTRNDIAPDLNPEEANLKETREKRAYEENLEKSSGSTENSVPQFRNASNPAYQDLIEERINVFPVVETTQARGSSDRYEEAPVRKS